MANASSIRAPYLRHIVPSAQCRTHYASPGIGPKGPDQVRTMISARSHSKHQSERVLSGWSRRVSRDLVVLEQSARAAPRPPGQGARCHSPAALTTIPSVCLSVCLSGFQAVLRLHSSLSVWLPDSLTSVCLSVCLSGFQTVLRLHAYLSLWLPDSLILSGCLSVCLAPRKSYVCVPIC